MKPFRLFILIMLITASVLSFISQAVAAPGSFSASEPYRYMLHHRARKYAGKRVNVMQRYFCAKNPRLSSKDALRYAAVVERVSRSYHIDPFLVAAVIVKESTVRRTAKSSSSYGLMQVNWDANKFWIRKRFPKVKGPASLLHSGNNIKVGAFILRSGLERSAGDVDRALDIYRGKRITLYRTKIFGYYSDMVEMFRAYF